ncbi:MAG: 2-C-methyl-D-erythritol 4-phosphate cytidylyltransferase, partial [Lachnospiraceae bacterium]|nr:2-C-methyl-D-erythritol 4-phosphate cytidylyltransferase [Lachnospiraceae bacterium]
SLEDVQQYGASIVAMPVKDTIKLCDEEQMVTQTPDRAHTWLMQTPQVFSYSLVKKAYEKLMESEKTLIQKGIHITDDAMVVETFFPAQKIHLVEGSYENFKVTTPEDLLFAQVYGKRRQ